MPDDLVTDAELVQSLETAAATTGAPLSLLLLAAAQRLGLRALELADCRRRCEGLPERVAKQSEILSRRAEKPTPPVSCRCRQCGRDFDVADGASIQMCCRKCEDYNQWKEDEEDRRIKRLQERYLEDRDS